MAAVCCSGQTLMAAADTAMVLAIMTRLGGFQPMTTVQLWTSSFLRPIAPGARRPGHRARCAHGKNLVFGEDRMFAARRKPGRALPPPPTRCCETMPWPRSGLPAPPSTRRPSAWCCRANRHDRLQPQAAGDVRGAEREQMIGQSFEVLYPTQPTSSSALASASSPAWTEAATPTSA